MHPYLRRREGLEPVVYPKPELEQVLGKTLGVRSFRNKRCASRSSAPDSRLTRPTNSARAWQTFKFTGGVSAFRDKLVTGMVANGYEQEFAEQTFKQLEGFGSYGFSGKPRSLFCTDRLRLVLGEVLASRRLLRGALERPAHGLLCACPDRAGRPGALRRSPPRLHQRFRWDCTLEPAGDEGWLAVRLGLRMVKGLANAHGATIAAARPTGPICQSTTSGDAPACPSASLVQLAEADAFRPAMGLDRREALWAIKALRDEPLPLFAAATAREEEPVPEVDEPGRRAPAYDRRERGCGRLRPCRPDAAPASPSPSFAPTWRRAVLSPAPPPMEARDGRWLEAAGLVLVRQRPGSAKGVMFITLEDETGIANSWSGRKCSRRSAA